MSAPVTSAQPRTSPTAAAHAPSANPLINHSRLGSKQHSAGGLGISPVQSRNERFASYEVGDFDQASRADIEWKYTPLDPILPLTAGELDGGAIDLAIEIAGQVSVESIERTDARIGSTGTPEDRASANAWTSFGQATLISVTGHDDGNRVTIDRSALGTGARAAHTVIEATPNSRGTVIIKNTGPALLSENLEIIVGEGAQLTLITLQEWDEDAIHLATHFARIERQGKLKYVSVTLGGSIVRVNPHVLLAGQRADGELHGMYFADAGQHIEHQVFINHDAPDTVSHITYKGALQGQGAHTVWIGDVLIGRNGAGTDSYEQNRNLLLSEGARADSIPNLEIETGDIKGAGHASTSGRFDDEQLFYLQARGIPELQARRLVVQGFLTSVVQKIGIPEIEAHVNEAIEAELAVTS